MELGSTLPSSEFLQCHSSPCECPSSSNQLGPGNGLQREGNESMKCPLETSQEGGEGCPYKGRLDSWERITGTGLWPAEGERAAVGHALGPATLMTVGLKERGTGCWVLRFLT